MMVKEYSGSGDPTRSMQLLWGVQERPKRGPKPRLTVEEITRVAIALADAEGLEAVSMRRVGEQLGVTAMSLYSYVPSKAELLDVMLDTVYGEVPTTGETQTTGEVPTTGRPRTSGKPEQGWRARLEQIARDNRELYVRHPWLLQVATTTRPPLGPNVVAKYEYELRAVDGLGLSDIDMDLIISLISDYVHGAVRTAIEAAQAEQRTGITDEQWWAAHAPLLEKVVDWQRFPVATRVGSAAGQAYNAAVDPQRSFEFGLQRLLDGVELYVKNATA